MLSDNWKNLNFHPDLILKTNLLQDKHNICLNDSIFYEILIKNIGNVVLTNIVISDYLYTSTSLLDKRYYNIDRLIIGETRIFSCVYNRFFDKDVYTCHITLTCDELNKIISTTTKTIIVNTPIYVADVGTNHIFKYNTDDILMHSFRVDNPRSVILDKDNNIYTSDSNNNLVYKYNSDGEIINILNNKFSYPTGLVIDSNNNLYVVDTFNYKIQKFSSNGIFLYELVFENEFGIVYGVAIDSYNNLYITDVDKHMVHIINANTGEYKSLNNENNRPFNKPHGVAIDSKNNIYVLDTNNSIVRKYDINHNYILEFGKYGSKNKHLKRPQGIFIDRFDDIYIADTNNCTVKKFTTDGVFISKLNTTFKNVTSVCTL